MYSSWVQRRWRDPIQTGHLGLVHPLPLATPCWTQDAIIPLSVMLGTSDKKTFPRVHMKSALYLEILQDYSLCKFWKIHCTSDFSTNSIHNGLWNVVASPGLEESHHGLWDHHKGPHCNPSGSVTSPQRWSDLATI